MITVNHLQDDSRTQQQQHKSQQQQQQQQHKPQKSCVDDMSSTVGYINTWTLLQHCEQHVNDAYEVLLVQICLGDEKANSSMKTLYFLP